MLGEGRSGGFQTAWTGLRSDGRREAVQVSQWMMWQRRLVGMRPAMGLAIVGLFLRVFAVAEAASPPALRGLVMGETVPHRIAKADTFIALAARYDVGYMALRAANPDVDPWVPPEGRVIRIPTRHVVPFAHGARIVINRAFLLLYHYDERGRLQHVFPVSLGREGLATPVGEIRISARVAGPSWYPTAAHRRENPSLPRVVPPGPDNPLGAFALRLGRTSYLIHGTNKPLSIGRRVSRGCIRLAPADIRTLFAAAGKGDLVRIVDAPMMVGVDPHDQRIHVEIAPSAYQQALLDDGKAMPADPLLDAETLLEQAVPRKLWKKIAWTEVKRAAHRRAGIPTPVSQPLTAAEMRLFLDAEGTSDDVLAASPNASHAANTSGR